MIKKRIEKNTAEVRFYRAFSTGHLRSDNHFSVCLAIYVLFTCLMNTCICSFPLVYGIMIDGIPNTPKYFTGSFNDNFCTEMFELK